MSLTLRDIHVEGDTGRPRLQDVRCAFRPGRVTLLLGKTGSGKSTLLDVASGLLRPASGEVMLNGAPLWTGKSGNMRNVAVTGGFGYVFQQSEDQLFASTVEGEFRYNLRRLRLPQNVLVDRATTALGAVQLSADVLPRSPFTLSGGQKRRVAFATTAATEPSWWFLDEPSAGLDPVALRQLLDWTQEMKNGAKTATGGILIATHDLDAFLPLADDIVVLQEGRIVLRCPAAELAAHADVLTRADIGLPSAMRLAALLKAAGCSVKIDTFDSDSVAARIVACQPRRMQPLGGHAETGMGSTASTVVLQAAEPEIGLQLEDEQSRYDERRTVPYPASVSGVSATRTKLDAVRALDPRAKWIAYLLVSIAFILGTSWIALGISLLLSIGCIAASGVGWRRVQTLARPFAWFIVLSTLFSGIRLHGSGGGVIPVRFGFAWSGVLTTLHHILPFLFVMCVGILLPETTSQLRLKQGLEQGLAWLKRVKLPVEALSLGTSLMLRFIPMISEQVERFSRIAKARGQQKREAKRLSPRDFVTMAIPLVIALLKLADELSHAMEVRGYRHLGGERTMSVQLRFGRADWGLVAIGIAVLTGYLGMMGLVG